MSPITAPTPAAAGRVTQNGAPTSLNRMPTVNAPAASSPAWPSETWPVKPASSISATAPIVASSTWFARSSRNGASSAGSASAASANAASAAFCARVSRSARSRS